MFEGGFSHRSRAFFFSFAALGFWLIWCLDPLLNNKPESFQAAGSIIVAWGIYSYGRERSTREKILNSINTGAIISAVNRVSAAQEFHESVAENTANIHLLNHYRLIKSLGMKAPEVGDLNSAIAKLEAILANRERHDELYDKFVKMHDVVLEDTNQMRSARDGHEPWVKFLTKLELYFVLFGTLQWGYGNLWVETLHEDLLPYFINK